jgi:hypothetical protein
MLKTDNYDLNIAQGTDVVNPLVMDNPNYQKIDKVMKDNEIRGIGTATELKTGSVHAITVPAQYTTFKFVATSDFIAGETFTVNGKQVTGYTTNQQPLSTNAYRLGATVLCSYIERTSTITLYVINSVYKTEDSEKLDGHPADYFAVRGNTNQTLEEVNTKATARGTLAQTSSNLLNTFPISNMFDIGVSTSFVYNIGVTRGRFIVMFLYSPGRDNISGETPAIVYIQTNSDGTLARITHNGPVYLTSVYFVENTLQFNFNQQYVKGFMLIRR